MHQAGADIIVGAKGKGIAHRTEVCRQECLEESICDLEQQPCSTAAGESAQDAQGAPIHGWSEYRSVDAHHAHPSPAHMAWGSHRKYVGRTAKAPIYKASSQVQWYPGVAVKLQTDGEKMGVQAQLFAHGECMWTA
jgi:hypothetical protein